jgi:heptosyltransferase III
MSSARGGVATRFFFLRPGALGDSLLLAPLLAALRQRQPAAAIVVACHPGAGRLLVQAGLVDISISQDDTALTGLYGESDGSPTLERLLEGCDVAVAWLSDPDGRVGRNLRHLVAAGSVIVTPSLPESGSATHVVDHLFSSLRPFGIVREDAPLPPLLRASAEDLGWAGHFLGVSDGPARAVVAVHPGSGGWRKNWPPARFAATIDCLEERFATVVLAGEADAEALQGVLRATKRRPLVAQNLSLNRLAALLASSAAYLGNDSGISHLAALLGTPTVALFGPTEPALWRPYGDHVIVLNWAKGGADSLSAAEVNLAVTRSAAARR